MPRKYEDTKNGVTTGDNFSNTQKKVITLMAQGGLTLNEISEKTKVSLATLNRWKNNPLFMDAVIDKARRELKNILPKIYDKLIGQALSGEFQYMKLLIEHLEKLDALKEKCASGSISFTWEAPKCPKE